MDERIDFSVLGCSVNDVSSEALSKMGATMAEAEVDRLGMWAARVPEVARAAAADAGRDVGRALAVMARAAQR